VLGVIDACRDEGLVTEALIVLRAPAAGELAALLADRPVRAVVAPTADQGISESLKAGFRALPPGDAAIVFLADQPAVRLETVRQLLSGVDDPSESLRRPRYRSDASDSGHPVLIGRRFWPLAERSTGDAGFGPTVRAAGLRFDEVEIDGRCPDVDTENDLVQLDQETSWK